MNIDIKKITQTIMRRNKGLQDPQLIYPARDWAIGMVGTLVIICLAVAFSVWQYRSYTDLSLDEEVILTMVAYRTEQVDEALARYRNLLATHNEIISATSSMAVVEEEGLEEGVEGESVEEEEEELVTIETQSVGAPSLAN